MLLRRRAVLEWGALAGLWLTSGCGSAEEGLRASITGKGESDTQLLLRAAGLAPKGYSVDYSEFQSGHLVIEALNGGSLDFGGMSEIPPVFAAASPVQSFRQITTLQGDVNNQVVLVPKGSAARTMADLRGRRVGYVRATTSHYLLIRALADAGLGWSDIVPVAMGVTDGAAAFSHGSLDAWVIYGFPIQRAIATEGARVLRTARGILSGNYVVVAQVDALNDPRARDAIGRYLRLLRRGYAWSAAHPAEWARVVAGSIGVPLRYVEDQFRDRSAVFALRPVTPAAIASQQAVADVFARAGLIPRRVDVTPLWDDRFHSILAEKV